jgi:hypothetical protein
MESVAEENEKKEPLVLYMLHCGLDGKLLETVCRRHGLSVRIRQFPREELFAYHMSPRLETPDLILIRGHFISLAHDVDQERHIPYVVVSSKLKYGTGQPVFIHAEKGYGENAGPALYEAIAEKLKEVVESHNLKA